MNKKERLEKIKHFVNDYEVRTQEEIVQYLKQSGMRATQATVSRDIKELGIVKVPLKDDTYIYEVPTSVMENLKLAENNILTCDCFQNMVNLNLIPGSTVMVKKHLLQEFKEQIFSIIADNDSILIVSRSDEAAEQTRDTIRNW